MLVWKHGNDVKLWCHKQHTPNANCRSAFPITTKWCFDQDVKVVPDATFTKRTCDRCGSLQKGGNVIATSQLVLRWKCNSPQTRCAQRATHKCMWRKQAIIKWSLLFFAATVWSFAYLPFELFDCNTRNILPCLSHAQYMKMIKDKHVLGFELKSCDISIYWWIWMLSFLLKLIWIGIDGFFNFFATFGSILGLQVNSGL